MHAINFYRIIEMEVKAGEDEMESLVPFVMGYWLEEIEYKGERKERFRFMGEDCKLRKEYEKILGEYDVNKRYVRFLDVNEIFYPRKKKMDKEEKRIDNVMIFYGLKKKESAIREVKKEQFKMVVSSIPGIMKNEYKMEELPLAS